MNKKQEIKILENNIKDIFKIDPLTNDLVIIGNNLINKWKVLTKWQEDTTPAVYREPILDTPIKKKFYEKT